MPGASHSLPLNRRRRLRRAVEHNTVDLAAFVRDARRDRREHVVWHARPVGRHRVLGTHGTQHDRHAVRAFVTLHTHGVHVGEQHDRALPDVAVQTGLRQFLTGDRVGVAQNVESFLRDIADDADAEARARERLAPDDLVRQAELGAERAHLILEQRAQRFDQFELEVVGQAAHIVVGLDVRRTVTATGFDDVGV